MFRRCGCRISRDIRVIYIRNAILIGVARSQKDIIDFCERSNEEDFLGAMTIPPSELTCDTAPARTHNSLMGAADFGAFSGNSRVDLEGGKTRGWSYNDAGYRPKGETEGTPSRIGLGES